MKHSQFNIRTKVFSIFLLFIFTLAAILIPPAVIAQAALIDPNISQWGGGGGGGGKPSSYRPTTTIYLSEAKGCADEVDLFTYVLNDPDYIFAHSFVYSEIKNAPSSNTNYNNIDYIIYMIRELETLAKDYLIYKNSVSDSPVENYSPSNRSINELVLGYIRGINVNYTESGALHYVKRWSMVAGTIDTAFIQYVSQYGNTGTDITFPAFFASFLQNASNYNTSLYGNISSTCLNKNYILTDPLSSGQGIDLIHMIASIDGIYSTTLAGGATWMDGNPQRDIASWLGDLQSFTLEFPSKINISSLLNYNISLGHIDFNEFINAQGDYNINTFSAPDLLADLDAMNITKFFLDNAKNSLSDSIAAYYDQMFADSSATCNRYASFIYTSAIEMGTLDRSEKLLASATENDRLNNFTTKTFAYMGLTYDPATSACTNFEFEGVSSLYIFSLMEDENGNLPPIEVRSYCTRLFYDYILAMSHRFEG